MKNRQYACIIVFKVLFILNLLRFTYCALARKRREPCGENMKHKNKLLFILVLCFAILFAVSLVACNPTDTPDDSDDPNNYEVATYTVRFNTNSDFVLKNNILRDIPYGTRIQEPADEFGNKIKPVKAGYTFQYWSQDGQKGFDFTQGITANITLTAIYVNNTYKHTANLRAEFSYNADTKTYTVTDNSREENEVTLSSPDMLYSTYASSGDKLPCPVSSDTNNKFCFWYYMEDGKPVQFSKWKADGEATVSPLESYYKLQGLTLYPMFEDNLPKVSVKYVDSHNDSPLCEEFAKDYVFGQNIPYTVEEELKPTKQNYKFDYWYYVVESTDKSGNTVYENERFIFDDGNAETKPTSPMDAAAAKDNFTPVELKLYAKWTWQATITSEAEYKAWLYDVLRIEDPTDEEKKHIDEILTSTIYFKGSITLTGTYEPLFDKDHPFKGTIEGIAEGDVKASISGGTFGNANSASVFGYNEGTIKNIDFNGITLNIADGAENSVYMGVIATDNAGLIENCNVTLNPSADVIGLKTVTFGGITAKNHGVSTRNGVIRKCEVNISGISFICDALTFGGIAGESDASASIVNNKVDITVNSVTCNGAYLTMGGMVGINASPTRLNTIKFAVNGLTSLKALTFGGVAGTNNGSVATTVAKVTLCSEASSAKAGGSLSSPTSVGGMFGKNEGYVINSYVIANLYVEIEDAPQGNLYIGGIVGSNYSDKKDTSTGTETGVCAINYCYSMGEIKVTVAENITGVNVYAGGIAGRNTHKKLASLFSTVEITVSNNGANNLGHIVGAMIKDSGTNGKIFYDKDGAVTLIKNGNTYTIKGDGAGSEEYVDFENVGNSADFTENNGYHSSSWVVGAPGVASSLGFNGEVWEVNNNDKPTLKSELYNENKTAQSEQ